MRLAYLTPLFMLEAHVFQSDDIYKIKERKFYPIFRISYLPKESKFSASISNN